MMFKVIFNCLKVLENQPNFNISQQFQFVMQMYCNFNEYMMSFEFAIIIGLFLSKFQLMTVNIIW